MSWRLRGSQGALSAYDRQLNGLALFRQGFGVFFGRQGLAIGPTADGPFLGGNRPTGCRCNEDIL